MPTDTPKEAKFGPVTAAARHVLTPRAEIQQAMGANLRIVHAALAAQNISVVGPWFAHHLTCPQGQFDYNICMPIDESASIDESGNEIFAVKLPEMSVLLCNYHGCYSGLHSAWEGFNEWVDANGYREKIQKGVIIERYVTGPEKDPEPSTWHTELILSLGD